MTRKSFKIACWLTLVIGVFIALWLLVRSAILPPRTLTEAAIGVMNRRILLYANWYDRLPSDISELPEANGYYNSEEDGWGRPILMTIEGDMVTLTSYGCDGRPGGTGEDQDMIGTFVARDEAGKWKQGLAEWLHHPVTEQVMREFRNLREQEVNRLVQGQTICLDRMEETSLETVAVVSHIRGLDRLLILSRAEDEDEEEPNE